MEPEARPTLGERLSKRLAARERRRPRIGFTPSFYTRLGLDDPWADPAGTDTTAPEGDGFVFLSAQPYYAMLRRLAAARRRRERRLQAFHERRAGTRMRAAQRAWPGEAPLATSRLARIALEDAVLPPPIPAPAPVDSTPAPEDAPRARWTRRNTPTPGIRSPWVAREHVPARVVRGSAGATPTTGTLAAREPAAALSATNAHAPRESSAPTRAARPLDRVGARAAATLEAPAFRALREASTLPLAGSARLRRVVTQLDAAPPEEHVILVRRALRAAGTVARQVIDVPALAQAATTAGPSASRSTLRAESVRNAARDVTFGDTTPRTAPIPATERAARRMLDAEGASLGLRPVLRHSPAMALAASADTDRASSGTLAEAAHADGERIPVRAGARPVRAAARGEAAQRAAARERASTPRAASVVPVAVPRVAPPASRAARPRAHALETAESTPVPPPRAATAPARRAASAHALARMQDAPAPAIDTARASGNPSTAGARSLDAAPPVAPRIGAADRTVTRSLRAAAPDSVLATPAAPLDTREGPSAPDPAVARARPATPTQRAAGRSEVPTTTGLVPNPVPRMDATGRVTPAPAPRALPRVVRLAATAAQGSAPGAVPASAVMRETTTRPPRGVAPARIPASTATAPERADATVTDAAPPRATATRPVERTAALRRGATRATANAARRAGASSMPFTGAAPAEVSAVSTRTPTGPLRFARGLTSRDLLAESAPDLARPAGASRPMRVPATAALLAQADAGTASVSAEAVVRLAGATGAPFVTAREARRRGLQVVATERGLVAAARAEDVARTGAPASARVDSPAVRAERGTTRRATGTSLDARYVVPVEVVDVAAPGIVPTAPTAAGARPAAPLRTRAVSRAMARQDVGRATAYRGALRDATTLAPPAQDVTDVTPTALARAGGTRATGTRTTPSADRGATRTQRGAALAPTALAAPLGPTDNAQASTAPPAPEGIAAATPAPRRAPLEERLARVSEGRTDGATGWVDRAEGSPRLSTVSGLIRALARASSNEDVVRVIAARGELPTGAAQLPLDAPAVQVIRQIREEVREELRTEVVQVAATETRASRLAAPEATALSPRALASTSGEGSRRRVRSSALRSAEATARKATGGEDRLSKLVRRLQDLIHLAEDQNRRAEAQSQVRMAEDTAQARAEAQATSESRSPAAHKVDVEALGREVLDIVTKEMELRRARRMEDSDESPWW